MRSIVFALCFMLGHSVCQAQIQKIEVLSEGIELNTYIYQAEGEDLKPTLIWCHGNPGGKEKGGSEFAIELNKRGINVVRFNYRGLWGTEGTYTPGNSSRDLTSVLDFLLADENGEKFGVDTSRIIVGGYSHGSNITIVTAMHDERIREIVLLGLADFSYLSRESFNPHNAGMRKFLQEVKDTIWGDANTGPGKYARDYDQYVFDILFNNYKYDFVAQAEKLKDKRLFIIVGMNDVTVPVETHFFPLYRKLKAMEHQDFRFKITDSNHSFRDISGAEKAELVSTWIKSGEPPLAPSKP